MRKRKPRSIDPEKQDTGAYFVTCLPIFLDYLAVEKGLAKNSLSSELSIGAKSWLANARS